MSKTPITPRYCPAWFVQIAEEMVRNDSSVKVAALDLGITLDPSEATRIERRKDFQEILRIEKNKYLSAVANDPSRTKGTLLGAMWLSAEKLEREGKHAESAAVLEKIAKIEGWAGADTNVNVFGSLNGKELAEAKERILRNLPKTAQA